MRHTYLMTLNHSSLLLLVFILPLLVNTCVITVDEDGNGFHRQMTLTFLTHNDDSALFLEYPISIVLEYPISSDMYIDMDEISNKEWNNTVFDFSSHVDTELPSYQANTYTVSIHTTLYNSVDLVKFPFHLRYQYPCSSYYKTVSIPSPLVKTSPLNCSVNALNPLVVHVPCGVEDHGSFVVFTTVLLSCLTAIGLSIYIML